jgi:UDP-glucose 4-epimerase
MKALVTGATGFIGSELVVALENRGYKLRILSRKKSNKFETTICNLGIDHIPESAFDSVDVVFHLAGYTHDLDRAKIKDQLYYQVNVKATIDLITVAAKKHVRKFIYISSVKAGGLAHKTMCMNENDQEDPQDIYGQTKREAEIAILKIGKDKGIHVSIIRPALVYGKNMKGNLAAMYEGISSGWFPPLPETSNKRSMICVKDLVRAIIFITENTKANSNIFIATDGYEYSTRDIYKALCSASSRGVPNWVVPVFLIQFLAIIGDVLKFLPINSYKYRKLFGSECYSSSKLHDLGFEPIYNFHSYYKKNSHNSLD